MNLEVNQNQLRASLQVEYRQSYSRETFLGSLEDISQEGALLKPSLPHLKNSKKITLKIKLGSRSRFIKATLEEAGRSYYKIKFQLSSNQDRQIIGDLIYFLSLPQVEKQEILYSIFNKAC